MIATWRRQAIDGMAATFSGTIEAAKAAGDTKIEKLHAKIGQLVVERDFCRRVRAMSVVCRRQLIEREHAACRLRRSVDWYRSADRHSAMRWCRGSEACGPYRVR